MARSLLFGTSVSPGIAIGVLRFAHNVQTVEMRRISPREVEGEQEQLRAAVTNVRAALQEAMAKVPEDLSEYREVIAAQIELARDPKLVGSALSRIEKELVCAAWALDSTVEQLCSIFRNMDDPYLRDRAQDIRAVGLRLRECLAGSCALPAAAGAGILAAQDLSPADVMDMDFKDVRAVITAEGGPTSHTAILSRGLHIPALVGVTGLLETGKPGEKVIVDGLNGCLLLDPDADDLATYEERQREYQEWEARTRSESHWPAEMRDGVRVSVHANLERLEEMDELQASGAEGVGLYRTEFSFLREHLPSEEELYAEYSAVARKAAPAHVVFRTLDAGADKMLRAQEALKEPNPALGLRGIRSSLRNLPQMAVQICALMRAAAKGPLRVMFPMVTNIEDWDSAMQVVDYCRRKLAERGVEFEPDVPFGVMLSVPAACLTAEDFTAHGCRFFVIGTNDLTQYTHAVSRELAIAEHYYRPASPAMKKLIAMVVDAARKADIPVTICGLAVGNAVNATQYLHLGLRSFSMSPQNLLTIKKALRDADAR